MIPFPSFQKRMCRVRKMAHNRSLQQTPASLAARLRRLALRAAAELQRYAPEMFVGFWR